MSSQEQFFTNAIFESEIEFTPTRISESVPQMKLRAVFRVAAFAAAATMAIATSGARVSSLGISPYINETSSTESGSPRMNDALLRKADRARAFLRLAADEPTDDGPDPD